MRTHRRAKASVSAGDVYARLRDEIWVRSGGALPGTLLVSSARRGEGRTSVVVGLARALEDAVSDGAVVLVDSDLRAPRLHEVLGTSAAPGLSDVLAGRSDLDAALQRVDSGRILLLPAGEHAENACMLIASDRMSKLVDELRSRAAIVIFDSPPTERAAEVASLAAMADRILLVVRSDRTEREAALEACGQLCGADKGRILGVVLNDVRFE